MDDKLLMWLTEYMVAEGVIPNDPYKRHEFRNGAEKAIGDILKARETEAVRNYTKVVDELRESGISRDYVSYIERRHKVAVEKLQKSLRIDRDAFYESINILAEHEGIPLPEKNHAKCLKVLRAIKAKHNIT